jgi:hypothetical protein
MGVGYIKRGTAKTWAIDKILDAKERDVFQPFFKLFGENLSCLGHGLSGHTHEKKPFGF